jgi:hypothetical protein
MSGCGYARARHQVAAGPLQPEPQNIRPQRDSHRLRENVHETRLRQARNAGQRLQREIIRKTKPLAEVLEYTIYARVNPHRAAPIK